MKFLSLILSMFSYPKSESHKTACSYQKRLEQSRLTKALEVVPLRKIKIMFLHSPSVLLDLVLFVPSTRCFAVVELKAKEEKKEIPIKMAHFYFI